MTEENDRVEFFLGGSSHDKYRAVFTDGKGKR